MPEERARGYALPFERVESTVRPERAKVKRAAVRERWWQFEHWRAGLYQAIASLDRCIAITQVSKTVQAMLVPTRVVFDQRVVVFAYDDEAHFGVLSSGVHWWWAVTHASTMRTDISYTPTERSHT